MARADQERLTLMAACWDGRLSEVERNIQAGEPLNRHNEDESSPLGVACFFGHARCARALMLAGVKPSQALFHGRHPLRAMASNLPKSWKAIASMMGKVETWSQLDLNQALEDACYLAQKSKRESALSLIDWLLSQGASPLGEGEALWHCCLQNEPRLLARLIDAGVQIQGGAGALSAQKAAQEAARRGHAECLRELERAGVDLSEAERVGLESSHPIAMAWAQARMMQRMIPGSQDSEQAARGAKRL